MLFYMNGMKPTHEYEIPMTGMILQRRNSNLRSYSPFGWSLVGSVESIACKQELVVKMSVCRNTLQKTKGTVQT